MRKIIQILLLFFVVGQLKAQELKCSITINSDKIPGSNKQVFTTLENSLSEYVNQKQWTSFNYKPQERINCNFSIIILEQSGDDFKGNIQIQSSRPVYNSTYLTPVFNYKDDNFSFTYREFETLQLNENSFESNLISVISYYAYIIIGMDADTFILNGGTPYYNKAENITVQAQQSGYLGWNQNDGSKTRFTLIDNLLSPTYSEYRTVLYDYHRNGLDIMNEDKKGAKDVIVSSIYKIKSLFDFRPAAFLVRIFMDSKSSEIVDVFSGGSTYDTFKLKEDLLKMSPINSDKWNQIK